MKINKITRVTSLDEAYAILESDVKASIIAGGAWLKLMPLEITEAIDLTDLGLDSIEEKNGFIEIGCMATLRQVETHPSVIELYGGVISFALEKIMGVTVRNIATIGGTIAGKYGFSDLITPLIAVGTELEFYKRGAMKLADFINETGKQRDILTKIRIPVKSGKVWFETIKITAIDFAVLNAAVANIEGATAIVIGSRPYKAELAEKAMAYIDTCTDKDEGCITMAAVTAAAELKFGSNSRGSGVYRKQLCEALVKRGLREVMS